MNAKMVVLMVVLLVLVGGGAFYLAQQYKVVPAGEATPTVPSVTVEVTQVVTPPIPVTKAPIPTQVPTIDDAAAVVAMVKASEVARVGADANNSDYTLSQIQGIYAKGMAGSSGGGAQWFAEKVGGVWKLVFIGNGTIQCSDLTNYQDYPKAWIPECWDSVNQKNVVR